MAVDEVVRLRLRAQDDGATRTLEALERRIARLGEVPARLQADEAEPLRKLNNIASEIKAKLEAPAKLQVDDSQPRQAIRGVQEQYQRALRAEARVDTTRAEGDIRQLGRRLRSELGGGVSIGADGRARDASGRFVGGGDSGLSIPGAIGAGIGAGSTAGLLSRFAPFAAIARHPLALGAVALGGLGIGAYSYLAPSFGIDNDRLGALNVQQEQQTLAAIIQQRNIPEATARDYLDAIGEVPISRAAQYRIVGRALDVGAFPGAGITGQQFANIVRGQYFAGEDAGDIITTSRNLGEIGVEEGIISTVVKSPFCGHAGVVG